MRRISRSLVMAAGLALALASCARREVPAPPLPPPAPPPPSIIEPRALTSPDYVALAGSLDLFELRSAELALVRATSQRNRDFAALLIEGHGGTSAQLSFAGRRLNLLPPATMLPEQQRMFDELAASSRFDASFHQLQLAAHVRALEIHSNYAARGQSPTLRPVASSAAAMIRSHLDWLRSQ